MSKKPRSRWIRLTDDELALTLDAVRHTIWNMGPNAKGQNTDILMGLARLRDKVYALYKKRS